MDLQQIGTGSFNISKNTYVKFLEDRKTVCEVKTPNQQINAYEGYI